MLYPFNHIIAVTSSQVGNGMLCCTRELGNLQFPSEARLLEDAIQSSGAGEGINKSDVTTYNWIQINRDGGI